MNDSQPSEMPRHNALTGMFVAFLIGLIVGGVGVHVASDYRKAFQQIQKENEVLKELNRLQKQEFEEIGRVIRVPDEGQPQGPPLE